MGLFDKFKSGLTKTKNILFTDVRDLFKSEGRLIDEEFLDEMRAILFKTDMGFVSAEEIVAEVAKNFRGRVVKARATFLRRARRQIREHQTGGGARDIGDAAHGLGAGQGQQEAAPLLR